MGTEELATVMMDSSSVNFAPKQSMEIGLCGERIEKFYLLFKVGK